MSSSREDVPRRVAVLGAGLIGTSIGLVLAELGVEVLLADRDPGMVRLAVDLGAGTALSDRHDEPVDLAVLAVPPGAVPATLLDAQKRGVAQFYTDVASVKERPLTEAARLGCDLSVFVAGHPLGGRERSGPLAARAGLFLGRPWVLCPSPESGSAAVEMVTALVHACGAAPVTMGVAEHDRAVALISHAPHVVASAMAARFAHASADYLGLTGQGARDVTRIAAGDPALWLDILSANAHPVADVLDEVALDLARTAAGLRVAAPTGEPHGPVADLLVQGAAGHGRIPGKHGCRPNRYATVPVLIPDRPGELALLFQAVGVAGVNIEDVVIEHSPGRSVGVVELSVSPESVLPLAQELRARGWSVPAAGTD